MCCLAAAVVVVAVVVVLVALMPDELVGDEQLEQLELLGFFSAAQALPWPAHRCPTVHPLPRKIMRHCVLGTPSTGVPGPTTLRT